MVLEKQFISVEKFWEISQAPKYQDCIVELVNGEIIELPLHGWQHGATTAQVALKVGQYIYEQNLGRAFAGGTGYVVERWPDGRDSVRGLDFAYISYPRAQASFGDYWLETSPDLVIEVVESCDSAAYMQLKVMQIINSGTPLVWALYPENRTAVIHSASGAITVEESFALSGGDILPGFEIRVAEIFPS